MKFLIAVFFVFPFTAVADPSTVVRYLMDEEVSMLDFALWRLESRLEPVVTRKVAEHFGGAVPQLFSVGTQYEWDRDLIVIQLSTLETFDDPETICRNSIESIRGIVGLTILDGWAFKHYGYQSSREPADLGKNLMQQTQLRCEIQETDGPLVLATSMLRSKDIAITRRNEQ